MHQYFTFYTVPIKTLKKLREMKDHNTTTTTTATITITTN